MVEGQAELGVGRWMMMVLAGQLVVGVCAYGRLKMYLFVCDWDHD